MVEAEHAQSDRARGDDPPQDYWRPYASGFRADPRRTGDQLADRLVREVTAKQTLIDVGAGGGRLALPFALRCEHVVAVEPSASMVSVLLETASEFDINNVSVVESDWQGAQVDPADVVLCVHVLYTIREIDAFLKKLDAHARDKVLIVLFDLAPLSQLRSLWAQIHGEERLQLPSLSELRAMLGELGIEARVEMLEPQRRISFETQEDALEQLARRLYLTPASAKMDRLTEMLPDILQEHELKFALKDVQPLQAALVSWRT